MKPLFQSQKPNTKPAPKLTSRVRISSRISNRAHDAILELQRRHRRQTGKVLRLWEILDAAVIAYAKQHEIKFHR